MCGGDGKELQENPFLLERVEYTWSKCTKLGRLIRVASMRLVIDIVGKRLLNITINSPGMLSS